MGQLLLSSPLQCLLEVLHPDLAWQKWTSLSPHTSHAPFSVEFNTVVPSPGCSLCWLSLYMFPRHTQPFFIPSSHEAGLYKLQHPVSPAPDFHLGEDSERHFITSDSRRVDYLPPSISSLDTALAIAAFLYYCVYLGATNIPYPDYLRSTEGTGFLLLLVSMSQCPCF